MKVRILVSLAASPMPVNTASRAISRCAGPGDVLDLHDEHAGKWIGSGKAERVVDPATVERTVEPAVLENVESRKSRREELSCGASNYLSFRPCIGAE